MQANKNGNGNGNENGNVHSHKEQQKKEKRESRRERGERERKDKRVQSSSARDRYMAKPTIDEAETSVTKSCVNRLRWRNAFLDVLLAVVLVVVQFYIKEIGMLQQHNECACGIVKWIRTNIKGNKAIFSLSWLQFAYLLEGRLESAELIDISISDWLLNKSIKLLNDDALQQLTE